MPELQRFVWEWSSLLDRLRTLDPGLEERLSRATRPIAAERKPDGRLVLVLGCWVEADRVALARPREVERVQADLKRLMEERIEVVVAEWPGGDGEPGQPPDPLAGLPDLVRAEGLRAAGAIQRAFFAAAAQRGVIFDCQYPVLNYRLDLALPRPRLGVEIEGWDWRAWARPGAAERREREQSLGYEGWTILWFTGSEIVYDRERCLDEVMSRLKR